MKKVLISGANGLLGQALVLQLQKKYDLLASGVEENFVLSGNSEVYRRLDISTYSACKKLVNDFVPDVIINAASFTQVDECEKQKELCWQVNVKGVENLANVARRYDIHLIHYSTDYVFDGKKGPYSENDRPLPVGYYGKSKLASENVLRQIGCPFSILRTCVLYGSGIGVKKNFFLWVFENLRENKGISVVTDQYNNPTLVEDLVAGSEAVLEQAALGTYHIAGKDYVNRFDFATAIARFFNFSGDLITPVITRQLRQMAPRPKLGGLKVDLAREKIGYVPRSMDESFKFLKWKIKQHE